MQDSHPEQPLWQPSPARIASSRLQAFIKSFQYLYSTDQHLGQNALHRQDSALSDEARNETDYDDLYRWSIEKPDEFWQACQTFLKVRWQHEAQHVYTTKTTHPAATSAPAQSSSSSRMYDGSWFAGAKLNYAENLLFPDGSWSPAVSSSAHEYLISDTGGPGQDLPHGNAEAEAEAKAEAVISYIESCEQAIRLSRQDLVTEVALCAAALKAAGVQPGDRIAGVLSQTHVPIIAMLASASIGAVWSSCSPDFGVQGVCERFEQLSPKVLFYTTRYTYQGKLFDQTEAVQGCVQRLDSLEHVICVDHLSLWPGEHRLKDTSFSPLASSDQAESIRLKIVDDAGPTLTSWTWQSWQARGRQNQPENQPESQQKRQQENQPMRKDHTLRFTGVDFSHPLFIMFSSGTTGKPKCIVHSHGGSLLQHMKEHALHCDIRAGDRLLYFTTCGWMMWNWMVSALAQGCAVVTFDGSPVYPDNSTLWQIAEQESLTCLGLSPKFIAGMQQSGYAPKDPFPLPKLRTVLSTGAPLLSEQFAWIYQQVKKDLHVASISGGTDILSCFLLGNPIRPVFAGHLQGPGLGMAVEVWNADGQRVYDEKGELVCTQAFPAMPTGFWQDEGNQRYDKAYFQRYSHLNRHVWHHGDFVKEAPRTGWQVLGRSDATLNPGGVRIGTAELYRVVEAHPGIEDSLAIGRKQNDGDTLIELFVISKNALTDNDLKELRNSIRQSLSPRHMPAAIHQVEAIPYTRSGKKMEVAVTQLLHGERVPNVSAMADSKALEAFKRFVQSQA